MERIVVHFLFYSLKQGERISGQFLSLGFMIPPLPG
jgi:hypothetical protein